MKNMFMAMSLLVTVSLSATPVGADPEVDPRVLSAFKLEFSTAKNVQWEIAADFTTARFSLYDQGFTAYFTNEGELMGTARTIAYMQLPLSIIKQLESRYTGYDISSIIEFTREGETSYYIQVAGKLKKLLLHAFPSGNISVEKRLK